MVQVYPTVTGNVRYRVVVNGTSYYQNQNLQLFREIIPGDSTITGLQLQNTSSAGISDGGFTWSQSCISPGTYYILLTGCNRLNEYVYPVIKLVEQAGDFCSAPMIAPLGGAGSAVATVTVDCHTIGTDYGEFNPTLTCPNGVPKGQYKTSWFRIDVTGTDTLDVTTFLTENTNALPADIKYRMMKGNCGAMQEQSCVQDALTQDTYKCLGPGSYFVQVFTPVNKNGSPVNGTISLNLSAVKHADTCAPVNNCLSSAAFVPQYDCTTGDLVTFNNFSTYGSGIQYQWDFGYNGQTSNAVAPVFNYPALSTAQTYTVKLTATNTGCAPGSSNTSTYTQTITIPARPNTQLPNDTTLCARGTSLVLNATTWPGATYQWHNGSTAPTFTATASGTNTYWVRVTYNGCVKRDTIVVHSNPNTRLLQTKYLCGADSVLLNSTRPNGETYLWNSGQNTPSIYASADGQYINDVNWKGCVVKDTFNVLKAAEPWAREDTTICFPFKSFALNAATPGAVSYAWQNGATGATHNVTAPGVYWVNIWNGTCTKKDSVVVKTTAAPKDSTLTASLCSGLGYTLPWGVTVTAPGTYRDTVRYAAGCDSLRQTVVVNFTAAAVQNTTASVCEGVAYTLPWGVSVSASGIYRDTIKSLSGCDSLVRAVDLTVKKLTVTNTTASVCAGQSFALPWGTTATATGVYRDTVRYANGCDSLIRSVALTVKPLLTQTTAASVCSGQNYTLPWGAVVSVAGTYRDTVHYTTGCDSLIRSVTLTVDAPLSFQGSAVICAGQSYTLPWGVVVSAAGVYRDTIKYQNGGCDSLVRTVALSVNAAASQATAVTLCAGQSYTLPWGAIVNAPGVYRDTVRYVSGCDSLRREVTLSVKQLLRQNSQATVCFNQSYTLPWGGLVSTPGVYSDTVRYNGGCDSLIRSVTLRVDAPLVQRTAATICEGRSYVLPWGGIASATGTYRDTLRFASGCDSLVRSVDLTVQPTRRTAAGATVCQGQGYTLPWGATVYSAGLYSDTLRYGSGCDSLVRQVNLTVKALLRTTATATICSGANYVLPWGGVVTATGTYRDTVRYASGCDSLIRSVDLRVTAPAVISLSPTICQGEGFALPWGGVASASGLYRDTIKSSTGCDSLVRAVNLTVDPVPVVRLTKSNDVSCTLGTANLTASGGVRYLWSPVAGLSNPAVANPVAAPSAATTYTVVATGANGCQAKDSIRVDVFFTDPGSGYLVPSAFTPNGDGKNDCFGVGHWGDVKDLEFSVFNRWGQLVFYTQNRGQCWDGRVAAELQKTDVYVFVIKAQTPCGPVVRKGTVTLIR